MPKKKPAPVAEPPLRLEWRSPAELAENPRNWRRHPDAQIAALGDVLGEVGWDGIGFCPLPGDNLAIIDLDKCRNRETGVIDTPAAAIVAEMDTYGEASPSGTGLRLVCRGRKPDRERSKRGHVEIYDGVKANGESAAWLRSRPRPGSRRRRRTRPGALRRWTAGSASCSPGGRPSDRGLPRPA